MSFVSMEMETEGVLEFCANASCIVGHILAKYTI